MSLNKFTDTAKGYSLELDIGADEIKANQIETTNIDLTSINGVPYMGGGGGTVTNPLSANLVLGGFSIIEPLAAASPSLNIDQLDVAKKIDLKVGGVPKIEVKDTEVKLSENLNMNQNQINDVSLITNTTAPLGFVGSSGTSAAVLDPDPSNSFNVLGQSDIKLQTNTDVILQSSTGFVDLNSNITRVNVGGITKLQVDASETTSSNNINMGDNEIQNLGKITSSADLTLTPANNVVCSTDLDMSNNSLLNGFGLNTQFLLASSQIETSQIVSVGLGQQSYVANPHRFTADGTPATQQLEINNVELSAFKPLNMNSNNIENAGDVALTSINTNVIYVPDGTMPTSFVADRTYIFLGSRSTATPIVLPAGVITLKGESRENSTIEYTGTGALFTSTDQDLSISDLGWSCTNTAGYFLDATNAAKDKLLTIQNCESSESYQVMKITGYDLVDFQNNVITYIRSGATVTNYGVDCIDVSKLEINSCEFIRWYEFGQPVNTNPFAGNMIDISGANGASQITNNIIHPRVAQNGIDIDGAATFGAGVNITGNTFVDAGLTTGVILETNSNADYDQKGITEANTLLPNLKARVGAQLSAANTITTATSGTPADINLNNLLVPFSAFGVLVGTGGGVTYNRTRPVNFQVTFVANLLAITGGSNQRVGLTVSKNGVNTGINSFVTLTSGGTVPQSVTLTLIGEAVQGDVFRSQLVNTSTSSNITCTDLIVSGIEI